MVFTVLQWNINGYYNNYNQLLLLINKFFPDVICLQETHIPFNLFSIPVPKAYLGHFYNLRNVKSKQGIGFLIKRQIPHKVVSNHSYLLSSVLELNISFPLKFVNCYFPPKLPLSITDIQSTCNDLSPPFIVLGDFNGWSPMWGSKQTNNRGSIIEKFIFSKNFILLNNGSPTHFSSHNSFTNIDLTLCSTDLHSKCDWHILDTPYGSDHFPILTNIHSHFTFGKSISVRKFQTDQANWRLFTSLCASKFNTWEYRNINHEVAKITKAIRFAANISIPQTKGGPVTARICWWNNELNQLRSDKLSAWKIFKRQPNTTNLVKYKKANAIFKRKVKQAKANSFAEFTSQINPASSLTHIWRKINSIYRPSPTAIQAIKFNNGILNSPVEICSAFGNIFSQNSMDSSFSSVYLNHKESSISNLSIPASTILSTDASSIELDFTSLELELALNKSKGKTPGLDRISYPLLLHLPPSAKSRILLLYNNIFSSGSFPHMWRKAALVCIPKPNKSPEDPNNYRPISLLPCLSKVYEKMLAKRLLWYISQPNKLSPNQIAYRPGQGTMDILLEFQHAAYDAISTKNHLSVLSIDFVKAFDRIGVHVVLERLVCWGIGPKIFNSVKGFMSNRSFQVKLQNYLSPSFPLPNGIPQGSPLSVILFMIAFEGVSCILSKFKGFNHRIYADDLIIFTKIKDTSIVNATFAKILDDLNAWGTYSGAKISLEKCKTFHICRKKKCIFTPVRTNNFTITHTNKLSILGILFDSKLSFVDHCLALRNNLSSRLNIIKHLSSKHARIHPNTLINITKSLLLSKIDYGLPIYGWCAPRHLQRISAPYHSSIRMSLSAFPTSPISCLLTESGMPHISDRVYACTWKLIPKFHNSRNFLLRGTLYKAASFKRPFTYLSTIRRCLKFSKEINIPTPRPNLPKSSPWWLFEPRSIVLNLHLFPKQSTPNDVFLKLFHEFFHTHSSQGWRFIYTDGSKNNNNTSFAVITEPNNLIKGGLLLPSTSVFTSEVLAIKLAIEFALQSNFKYIVCTDSLSACQAIGSHSFSNSLASDIKSLLIKFPKRIKILWVPSHIGIPGNEAADRAAKDILNAPMHTFFTNEPTDIRHLILQHINLTKRSVVFDPHHHYLKTNPTLTPILFPVNINKFQARLFTRLRIGHTSLSHSHILNKSRPAICPLCGSSAGPLHILDECQCLSNSRKNSFPDSKPSILLSSPSVENIERIYEFFYTHKLCHLT